MFNIITFSYLVFRKKLLSLNYILSKKKLFLDITKIFLDFFFISVSCITFSGLPDISVV